MSTGLDTSVVLRLLVGEPEDQARRALAEVETLMRRGSTLLVSDLVVSEVYYALQYHYRVPKVEALSLLKHFFGASGIKASGGAMGVLATPSLATAKPGFVDRLIHADYALSTREVLTFEQAAGRLQGVRVLKPET